MSYLLDTSAWLAHYRKERGSERVQALFRESENRILLASVSVTEFSRRLRDLGASIQQIRETLTRYRHIIWKIVPVDGAVAMSAFEILHHTPQRLPLVDAIIAAAAQSESACLVHRDKHMRSISPLFVRQQDLDAKIAR